MNKKEKEMFDLILLGIDKEETEHLLGWWETSTGALFGKNKKDEIKQYISKHYIHRETVLREVENKIEQGTGISAIAETNEGANGWNACRKEAYKMKNLILSDIKTFINNN